MYVWQWELQINRFPNCCINLHSHQECIGVLGFFDIDSLFIAAIKGHIVDLSAFCVFFFFNFHFVKFLLKSFGHLSVRLLLFYVGI